jgi:peroxiredoxin
MKATKAIVTGVAAFAAVAMLGNAPFAGVEVGKPAPDFKATDSNGKEFNLADYKGKTVVLEWTNHGCPYVVSHYQGNMQALQKKYTEKGVVWITVISSKPGSQGHVDGAGANELSKSRGAVPTRVVLDPSGVIGKQYDAKTTPHMFVIDANGVLRYDGAIDANRSSRAADHKPEDSYVAHALDAVMSKGEVKVTKTQPYGCNVKY